MDSEVNKNKPYSMKGRDPISHPHPLVASINKLDCIVPREKYMIRE